MRQVMPGIYRHVSQQQGPQHPVNSYIIDRGADGAIVIDPAADLTPAALRELTADHVSDVLVTHLQTEHIAGAAAFESARLHVPEGDAYLAQGPEAYRAIDTTWPEPWDWEDRGLFAGHLAGALNERPAPQPLTLDAPLRAGEACAGFDVIATPGHGKAAVTLLAMMDGRRVAWCGDLIYEDGRLWNWFDADWDYGPQTGQRTLRASIAHLRAQRPDVLLPAHGEPIEDADQALERLADRLDAVLAPINDGADAIDKAHHTPPATPSDAPGFERISPGLHQWRETPGNCAVLVSETGRALLIDDGLCTWKPLPQRRAHHRQVMQNMKQALGVERIDTVIITHYHGDHIEHIPELVEMEDAQVVTLDSVADVVERPETYNLACRLPFYGTGHHRVPVHRRVREGETMQWHEYTLEFFHLGGQTYYHCGIDTTIAGQRVLFVGDAVGGIGVGAGSVLCFNDAEPDTRGWAYAVDRMLERAPDLLVAGHAAAVRDPAPLLRQQRANWDKRLAQYRALSAHDELRRFFDPLLQSHDPAADAAASAARRAG